MASTTFDCTCGATLWFKHVLSKEQDVPYPTWKCRQCGTPIPAWTLRYYDCRSVNCTWRATSSYRRHPRYSCSVVIFRGRAGNDPWY
ncbi:hypothetical protein BRD03_13760 [Halobacteriales archaeon QS_9_68_17]|nr:MAG: hypothetical protein BRD03_13760 [Halobacteriales archaeon QS_9_68_17]